MFCFVTDVAHAISISVQVGAAVVGHLRHDCVEERDLQYTQGGLSRLKA